MLALTSCHGPGQEKRVHHPLDSTKERHPSSYCIMLLLTVVLRKRHSQLQVMVILGKVTREQKKTKLMSVLLISILFA